MKESSTKISSLFIIFFILTLPFSLTYVGILNANIAIISIDAYAKKSKESSGESSGGSSSDKGGSSSDKGGSSSGSDSKVTSPPPPTTCEQGSTCTHQQDSSNSDHSHTTKDK